MNSVHASVFGISLVRQNPNNNSFHRDMSIQHRVILLSRSIVSVFCIYRFDPCSIFKDTLQILKITIKLHCIQTLNIIGIRLHFTYV